MVSTVQIKLDSSHTKFLSSSANVNDQPRLFTCLGIAICSFVIPMLCHLLDFVRFIPCRHYIVISFWVNQAQCIHWTSKYVHSLLNTLNVSPNIILCILSIPCGKVYITVPFYVNIFRPPCSLKGTQHNFKKRRVLWLGLEFMGWDP